MNLVDKQSPPNRVTGRFSLPVPTAPRMRLRTGRFLRKIETIQFQRIDVQGWLRNAAPTNSSPIRVHRHIELYGSSLLSEVLIRKASANSPTAPQKQATPLTHYDERLATMATARLLLNHL
jgi:hypothetical protein